MTTALPELAVDPHDHATLNSIEDATGILCFCANHPEQARYCPVHNGELTRTLKSALNVDEREEMEAARDQLEEEHAEEVEDLTSDVKEARAEREVLAARLGDAQTAMRRALKLLSESRTSLQWSKLVAEAEKLLSVALED